MMEREGKERIGKETTLVGLYRVSTLLYVAFAFLDRWLLKQFLFWQSAPSEIESALDDWSRI